MEQSRGEKRYFNQSPGDHDGALADHCRSFGLPAGGFGGARPGCRTAAAAAARAGAARRHRPPSAQQLFAERHCHPRRAFAGTSESPAFPPATGADRVEFEAVRASARNFEKLGARSGRSPSTTAESERRSREPARCRCAGRRSASGRSAKSPARSGRHPASACRSPADPPVDTRRSGRGWRCRLVFLFPRPQSRKLRGHQRFRPDCRSAAPAGAPAAGSAARSRRAKGTRCSASGGDFNPASALARDRVPAGPSRRR